jgi:hypothetical protein
VLLILVPEDTQLNHLLVHDDMIQYNYLLFFFSR